MTTAQLTFNGTERDQDIARLAFQAMTASALLFSNSAPIRKTLGELAEFVAHVKGLPPSEATQVVLEAVRSNPHIFAIQESDGTLLIETTKAGRPPAAVEEMDTRHMLASRLYEPPPGAIKAPVERRVKIVPEEIPAEEALQAIEIPLPAVEVPAEEVTRPAPRPAAPVTHFEVAPGVVIDLTKPTADIVTEYGDHLEKILVSALSEDKRFVNFGRQWFLEEGLMRFSKGDIKRIREWIREVERPLSDIEIMQLMGRRPGDKDFELARFSLNVKLAKEKGFEFVGVEGNRLWATDELPPIGLQRRKPAEIGTDLRYLEEPMLSPSVEGPVRVWQHALTWFEYENGLLPYDAYAKALFPRPFLEDQKSVVLRFDSPQLYASYLVELHYPTPSRGGWLSGLEAFFEEVLIPGAIVIISATDQEDVFTIEYVKVPQQYAQLLTYDEKKRRFQFKTVSFSCDVDQSLLLTAARFGKLDRTERLDEVARRRLEIVIPWAFRMAGEVTEDGRIMAFLQDLVPVVNIERPFNAYYLKHLLRSGQVPHVEPSPEAEDLFYYSPPKDEV
jgi:hypothetical protein